MKLVKIKSWRQGIPYSIYYQVHDKESIDRLLKAIDWSEEE